VFLLLISEHVSFCVLIAQLGYIMGNIVLQHAWQWVGYEVTPSY